MCTITGGRSETGAGNCFSHDKQDESVRAVSASVIVEKESARKGISGHIDIIMQGSLV